MDESPQRFSHRSPEEVTTPVTFGLYPGDVERLNALAVGRKVSRSALIRDLISKAAATSGSSPDGQVAMAAPLKPHYEIPVTAAAFRPEAPLPQKGKVDTARVPPSSPIGPERGGVEFAPAVDLGKIRQDGGTETTLRDHDWVDSPTFGKKCRVCSCVKNASTNGKPCPGPQMRVPT